MSILPASTSCITAAAVNCLVIDPMRYTVSAVAETLFSMSARPYPLVSSRSPPRFTPMLSAATEPPSMLASANESILPTRSPPQSGS